MRKILKGIIALILVCTLIAGCGESGKPDGVSDEMYEAAIYAIKVVDLYLDGESTIKETYDKLDSMKVPDYEMDGIYKDMSIYTSIKGLETSVMCIELGTAEISDLKDDRNELAEKINYKE